MEGGTAAGRDTTSPPLDGKTEELVRLGALIATGGAASSYRRRIASTRAAGATDEEVVGVLLAVAPTIGLARLVTSTSMLALGLGYDIDQAFEGLDG
jgi:alkylhydroperoxidase/carboxymuconolactone decarboxylase family protein YurZ